MLKIGANPKWNLIITFTSMLTQMLNANIQRFCVEFGGGRNYIGGQGSVSKGNGRTKQVG